MRVVFMGTPDISATCLKQILEDGFSVVGVYTQPDRPKNRGMKLTASPVKELALEKGIPVFQPENFKSQEAVDQLKALDSAPYQWAVLNGEKETGVTAMYLTRKMDAGDMIDTAVTPIDPEETAGELLDRLAVLGAGLLSKTLGRFARGEVEGTKQDEALVTYAPMLDKSMSPISWEKTAQQVHDQVRGLNPWPIATMELEGKRFKVYKTVIVPGKPGAMPGTVLGLTKTGLQIACSEGAVEIQILQAEGGKRMGAPDYFRGHPLGG